MNGYLNNSVKMSAERILLRGPSHPQFENDAHKIASAVFALVDDTPATPGWITDIGAAVDFQYYFEELLAAGPESLINMPVPALKTRGKVRQLCDVLKVPTREEPEA